MQRVLVIFWNFIADVLTTHFKRCCIPTPSSHILNPANFIPTCQKWTVFFGNWPPELWTPQQELHLEVLPVWANMRALSTPTIQEFKSLLLGKLGQEPFPTKQAPCTTTADGNVVCKNNYRIVPSTCTHYFTDYSCMGWFLFLTANMMSAYLCYLGLIEVLVLVTVHSWAGFRGKCWLSAGRRMEAIFNRQKHDGESNMLPC